MMDDKHLAFFLMLCIFLAFVGLMLMSWFGLIMSWWWYAK